MSGIGKGIIVASIATILKNCDLKVNTIKLDPYLNIDAGTINPFEHGETFITSDGLEADLDLGHYERFTNQITNKDNIITSGKIYQNILSKERKGEYLGKTVQMIPHVTNEIINFIMKSVNNYDITICEIGGTVGDIESMVYMESIRQLKGKLGITNVINVFLTYIPFLEISQEFKTKPSQDSIKTLLQTGIIPDIIICRYEKTDININFKNKISLFSNLPENRIILAPNVNNIYQIPYIYAKQNIHYELMNLLNINYHFLNISPIEEIYNIINSLNDVIIINIITKYDYKDAYISLFESLKHASYSFGKNINFNWIDVRNLDDTILLDKLKNNKYAMLVPGGFGESGVENKIKAIKYAREYNIPFLGICYGMQLMCIEYARNVLGIKNANTQEIDPTNNSTHIVHIINPNEKTLGGTMRLGNYEGNILNNSLAYKIYDNKKFIERHRHRYEINTNYLDQFENNGLIFSGRSANDKYMEIAEIPKLKFFIATQYHPEFNSSIFKPNPIIKAFVNEAWKYQNKK